MTEEKSIYIEDLPNGGYNLVVPKEMKELTIGASISGRPETRKTATQKLDFEPKIIDYYITDIDNNRIEDYSTGDKIILNIETKNHIKDMLDLSLKDKKHDFLHDGIVLENDTFEDYEITSNHDKITLEVIDEQN